jgi:predicted ATPase
MRIAAQQPVLFVVEDLHWIDPSTLEFLSLLVDQGPTARILALLTFRPDFSLPWTGRSHITQVMLSRLPPRQAAEMTGRMAHSKALPVEVVEQVVAKTDGVPLFVEELTKMILESGLLQEREERYELTGPLPPLAIPTTLHDSLMARLDRLATVKSLAQLGATLGREFSYALLQAVSPWDEATVLRGLHQLVEAEFLYQQGLPPQATYLFKHALIQEAAYQSLLRSTRQQYHYRIAQVLEARFPELRETQPELLAHHYTEAGLREQAIAYWQWAGERSIARSAYVEAINQLSTGLENLKVLPETPERIAHELTLLMALGRALIATKGYAASEVGTTYTRARALCQQGVQSPQLFPVLFGLWQFYVLQAELPLARELGEQLLALAQHLQDSAYVLEAHRSLAFTLFSLGEMAAARAQAEQGIALYHPHTHHAHVFTYGQDPGTSCLAYAALALWYLGHPEQALQRCHEMLTLAHELSHPFSLAHALYFGSLLHQHRREVLEARECAEAAITLATEHGFALYVVRGRLQRSWALTEQGQLAEGIDQMRQSLTAYRATGSGLVLPYFLARLAEAYGKEERIEAGLYLLDEALTLVEKHGECWWEAEIHRLKGVFMLQQAVPDAKQAEGCLQQALATASRQQAKSLELRAATSLSRLWQQQGKRDDARDLLAPIYNWFTEGFDTTDLQEAKALLEKLS